MNALDFFKAVLGDSGWYCAFSKDPIVQKFYQTIEELDHVTKQFSQNEKDSYFALATFKNGDLRESSNALQIKSFFVDIDADHGAIRYDNKQEAVKELRGFCKALSLPKPVIVDSGGGIHAYWILDEPVSMDDWKPVALSFRQACIDHGLRIDPKVTGDGARVLRTPNTYNTRSDTYSKFLSDTVNYVPFSLFADKFDTAPAPVLVSDNIDQADSALLDLLQSNVQGSFAKIEEKNEVGQGCAQLDYILKHQDEVSEPLWRAGLSIAKFCEEYDEVMHRMSENHPEYDPSETEYKLSRIKGPYRCSSFEEERPEGCEDCPHKGQINTPWSLGRKIAEAEGEEVVSDLFDDQVTYTIPEYPKPYFRGLNGGVYIRSQTLADDEPEERLVYHNDIYVTRRIRDPELGESIIVNFILPQDGKKEFVLPLTAATSREEFRKAMSHHGVVMMKMENLMAYIQKWVEELQLKSKADESRRQFGWTKGLDGFVVGAEEITKDEILINHPSPPTARFFPAFEPKGTYEKWQEMIETYNRPDLDVHQFCLAFCLGSPLFEFIPKIQGGGVHLFSGDSGFGKTSVMDAGNSIWGGPSLRIKGKDTGNFTMNRAEIWKNLPLLIDEVGDVPPHELSALAMVMTDGEQKGRMSSGANQERIRGEPWSLGVMTNGNNSFIERVSTFKNVPRAEAQRILEWECDGVNFNQNAEGGEESDRFNDLLEKNYGWAGPIFIRYILNNKEEVQKLVTKTSQVLNKKLRLAVQNRVWKANLTVAIAANIIANRLGIWSFDTNLMLTTSAKIVKYNREKVVTITRNATETINEYVAENIRNIYIINSKKDLRKQGIHNNALDSLVKSVDPYKVVGRLEPDTEMLYLAVSPLRKWCLDQRVNYSELDRDLCRNHNAHRKNKRLLAGHNLDTGPVKALWVNVKDILDLQDEDALRELEKIASLAENEDDQS
jgi:hypothetical protein